MGTVCKTALSVLMDIYSYPSYRVNQSEQLYDNKGRISQSDVGNYSYENSSIPYQNSKVALTPAAIEHYTLHPLQEVTYNAFKSPIRIYEQNYDKIDFSYNTFQNRSSMFYGGLQDDKLLRTNRKHYAADGSMEIKHNIQTQAVEFITYIGGDAYSAPVIFKSNGALLQEFLYLHRDYLGSIVAITNQAGTIVEKRHFDAWGNVAKVQDGSGTNLQGLTIIDRGYTGHEHLQSVGLIHMNGRLYDPKVHRFLQPDNFIQDTSNTQNYNRYGYVLNNPLKYTDPSGEIIELSFLTVVYIAAALSAAFYLTDAHMNGPITLRGFLTATFIGAISGAATFGIGTGAGAITGNLFLKASIQAVAHGIFQGGMNQISAGDFWSGFASGAVASLASTAFQGGNSCGSNYNNNYVGLNGLIDGGDFGTVVFGAISGGAAAELSGGNFVMGAWRGAMVAAFNHLAHEMGDEITKRNFDKEIDIAYENNADSVAPATNQTLSEMKNNLPTLKRIHPKTGFAALDAEPSIYTLEKAEARTWAYDTDKFKKSNIVFYRASFSSFRNLAHNMLHEFGHAVNFFNMNYNTYRSSHSAKASDAWGERQAFKFAFDNGGRPYQNNGWYLQNK